MTTQVAFVTGANQGLGLSLVRALCRQLGAEGVVYLAARDRGRGEQAVARLTDEGLNPVFHPLDVRDTDQVNAAAELLRERHGGVDIVLSNAALRRRALRRARPVPDRPAVRRGSRVLTRSSGLKCAFDTLGGGARGGAPHRRGAGARG